MNGDKIREWNFDRRDVLILRDILTAAPDATEGQVFAEFVKQTTRVWPGFNAAEIALMRDAVKADRTQRGITDTNQGTSP